MRQLRFVVLPLAVLLASNLQSQTTRREVIRATTPELDAKGLDPKVPNSIAVSTQFERIIVLRCKNQADLLAEIEGQVAREKIQNAVILSGIGSAMSTHYHMVTNREFPSKNTYFETKVTSADIIGMNGYILSGKVHAHITFANPEKSYGGHLESGTKVFTFAIVTIGVLPDNIPVGRFDDKTLR